MSDLSFGYNANLGTRYPPRTFKDISSLADSNPTDIPPVSPSENSFYPERTGTKAGRSGTKMGERELRRTNRDETRQIHVM